MVFYNLFFEEGTLKEILLHSEKISKNFPGVKALDNINFDLRKGELHCLVGENGAGKTTFVKILSGAYPSYEGDIFISGENVYLTDPIHAFQYGIAAIQQHRDLVPTLTGVENIFLGLEETKGFFIDMHSQYKNAKEITDRFNEKLDLYIPVQFLTVAEQEIIAIAKALVRNCQILLIDEATAPLDRNERKTLFDVLIELKNEQEKGIVFISHNVEELFEIGDRVTVFQDGKLVDTRDIRDVTVNEVIRLMIGKEARERYVKKNVERGEEILRLENVTVHNKLHNVRLEVRGGEIVGVAGKLGSNKEIIADVIFGLTEIDEGEIFFKNTPLNVNMPVDAIQQGIGMLPLDRREEGLVLCRGVAENAVLTWMNKLKKRFSSIKFIHSMTKAYIDKLDIKAASINQRVEYLSGGNQQKVVMSKWLVADADLLILVEPTEGIDVKTRWEIYTILEDLAAAGKGILVISSDVDELIAISDKIVIMRDKRIAENVEGENINKEYIFEKTISSNRDN